MHGNIKTKTETPLNPKTNKPIYQSDNGLIGYRKSIQFAYHPNNELKQTITIIDTGLQVQRTTTSYHYDAFGRRIAKNSKTQTLNKLNQKGKLVKYPTTLLHLRKTDKTKHHSTLMLWEGNRQIQEYAKDFVFTTVYDNQSFEPVSRLVQDRQDTSQIKVYHYHNNHLGTPQELTDNDGNVVWANYEYAWDGSYQSYYKEQSLNDIVIDKDHLQPLKFQGQFFDSETSLHYNRFRYYDSDVGMFIQRDPIGLLGGNNVFQYAPNPIGWVDPWGLSCTTNSRSKSSKFDDIMSDLDKWSLVPISNRQKGMIKDKLATVKQRSKKATKAIRDNGFSKSQEKALISRWEKETGNTWPSKATPHHIIPLKNGGTNEWWNLAPVKHPHTGTIHGQGSALRTHLPYSIDVGTITRIN